VVKILQANNNTDGRRNNANFNLNYRYADSSGHELNMDADYVFTDPDNQYQPNMYYDPSGIRCWTAIL